MNCNYANNRYSQEDGEIVSCFRQVTKYCILQLHVTLKDFLNSKDHPQKNPGSE